MSTKDKVDTSNIRTILAANIVRLRKATDLSQLALAKRAGLTHNFVNDIENGKKGISLETLGALSAALGTEPYQFFLDSTQWLTSEKQHLIGIIETLNRDVNRLFDSSVKELAKSNGKNKK